MLADQYALVEVIGVKVNRQRQGGGRRQQGRVVHLGAVIELAGGKVQCAAPSRAHGAAVRGPRGIVGGGRGAVPEVAVQAVPRAVVDDLARPFVELRSEEHTSELQSL